MQIHLLPYRLPPFSRVDEFAADGKSEADVVGATAPFEIPNSCHRCIPRNLRPPLVVGLAVARVDGALAAGPRDGVGDGGAGYGVDEGGFSTA